MVVFLTGSLLDLPAVGLSWARVSVPLSNVNKKNCLEDSYLGPLSRFPYLYFFFTHNNNGDLTTKFDLPSVHDGLFPHQSFRLRWLHFLHILTSWLVQLFMFRCLLVCLLNLGNVIKYYLPYVICTNVSCTCTSQPSILKFERRHFYTILTVECAALFKLHWLPL